MDQERRPDRPARPRAGRRWVAAIALSPRRRAELDAAIARGDQLDAELARHAARLARPSVRRMVAGELDLVLVVGQRPLSQRTPSTVDIDREAVLAARSALEVLISRLRSPRPVSARGVALSRALVRDPWSPLYGSESAYDLRRAVWRAFIALEESGPPA